MFVHMTSIHVALGEIVKLRQIMSETFLPLVYKQPGMVRAYLVEQVDDADHAQLILVWESQALHERFRNSKAGEQLFQQLSSRPGWRIQCQSYVVRLKPEDITLEVPASDRAVARSGG